MKCFFLTGILTGRQEEVVSDEDLVCYIGKGVCVYMVVHEYIWWMEMEQTKITIFAYNACSFSAGS